MMLLGVFGANLKYFPLYIQPIRRKHSSQAVCLHSLQVMLASTV